LLIGSEAGLHRPSQPTTELVWVDGPMRNVPFVSLLPLTSPALCRCHMPDGVFCFSDVHCVSRWFSSFTLVSETC